MWPKNPGRALAFSGAKAGRTVYESLVELRGKCRHPRCRSSLDYEGLEDLSPVAVAIGLVAGSFIYQSYQPDASKASNQYPRVERSDDPVP